MPASWSKSHRRRGVMYVAVLGCALVVTTIGVAAVMAARIESRTLRGSADLAAARTLAQSVVDLGLFSMYHEPTWRTSKSPGAWRSQQPAGEGTFSLSVSDPIDGVLSDANWEPIVFTGTGAVRDARYMLEATTVAQSLPLAALNTCLHSGGKVTVSLGKSITVSGAPLSMNSSVNGPGTINGTVHAASTGATPPTINGTSVIPSAAKDLPDTGVFSMYQGLATTISGVATIDRQVLTPSSNPWGTPNPDGVYYINAGTSDLVIRRSRIEGTLVVQCATGKKVSIQDAVYMYNYRADYPVLIVNGGAEINLPSTVAFSESAQSVNLNPVTAPVLNVSDTDESDTYPNEIQGLIHVIDGLTLTNSSIIRGAVLAHGNVLVSGTPTLYHSAKLYENPPMGYVTYSMQLASGSWRRVVNP